MAQNINCGEQNHKWGFCLQICNQCNQSDRITVNLCESKEIYYCYACSRVKVGA
jgi:hypothetical protein